MKKRFDLTDFNDFIATPVATERTKRFFFETKDSSSETGHRLMAKVKMTFAGIKTKNKAVYLPDEHFKSAKAFITPYPKPIQVHHNDDVDAIGRIIDVRYVDTSGAAIALDSSLASVMNVFRDAKVKPTAKLKTVPAFIRMTEDPSYQGVGHILGLWDVRDPEAIRKILDGRYLTVSTGMSVPEHVYCSTCALDGKLTDWRKEHCDHERGDVVDGVECVAIPIKYGWDECSPVNLPASPLSQIVEFGEELSFADAVRHQSYSRPIELFTDMYIQTSESGPIFNIKDSTLRSDMPTSLGDLTQKTPVAKNDTVIGENEAGQNNIFEGNEMKQKLVNLTKDTASNYDAIAKHLPESVAKLTGALLADLDDAIFLGPNRTFPAKDKEHLDAIKALLEDVEEGEAKASLVDAVEAKLATFTDAVVVTPVELTGTEANLDATGGNLADSTTESDETVKITKIALAEYEDAVAKVLDLSTKLEEIMLDRDIVKQRLFSLKGQIDSLTAVNSALLADQKTFMAETLVDAQIVNGFNIKDRVESVKKYSERSLESLKDQLSDIKTNRVEGTSRVADGTRVENPLTGETDSTTVKVDLAKYQGIIDDYYDKFYDGVTGPQKAQAFLNQARSRGLFPADVNL